MNLNQHQQIHEQYRSSLLTTYIKHWGNPNIIKTYSKDSSFKIEILVFHDLIHRNMTRIVTFGFVNIQIEQSYNKLNEYYFILPTIFVKQDMNEYIDYLMNLGLHLSKKELACDVSIITDIQIAPLKLKQKCILDDEACLEHESFNNMYLLDQDSTVQLRWLIPIFDSEAEFILHNGVEAFEELERDFQYSLINIDRPTII
ncbi:suppressor of fused domain protein [Acinetobacter sp. CFCC 10889]|uniref:suppressor of fused domain protein n=1 Tax=Acinetobacter sp. CFCC 10889 TaxID=1775557 RepID=UPI002AF6A257|nr:suppressor of fused domain protein [Acinetobacter sp. CFCC 10889]